MCPGAWGLEFGKCFVAAASSISGPHRVPVNFLSSSTPGLHPMIPSAILCTHAMIFHGADRQLFIILNLRSYPMKFWYFVLC